MELTTGHRITAFAMWIVMLAGTLLLAFLPWHGWEFVIDFALATWQAVLGFRFAKVIFS